MELLVSVAFSIGVVAYSVAATLFFLDIARRDGAKGAALWAGRAFWLATLLHSFHLVGSSFSLHVCPVMSLPFALSLFSLILCFTFLLLRHRSAVGATGAAIAPIALVFMVGAQFVSRGETPRELPVTLLAFHVASNLLGLGLFVLAGVVGGFYLVQERRLKHKRRTLGGSRLPALDVLDVTEHRLLLAGFPLLTIGIVTGAVFMAKLHEAGAAAWMRASLAYLAWGLVAGVLILRVVAGWRGRRAAYGTLAGAACVLLILVGYVLRAGGVGSPV